MSPRRPVLALLGAAALCAAGCGARTGLVDDREAPDDGADADLDGGFPCTYSRTGHLSPIAPSIPYDSFAPDLACGGGRLAAAFTAEDLMLGDRYMAFCATDSGRDWACDDVSYISTGETPATLTWDGEAFGACWNYELLTLGRFSPAGELLDLFSDPSMPEECREIAWAGGSYLVATRDYDGARTAVISMSRDFAREADLLDVPAFLGDYAPFALAADGDVAAAAWVDADGLHLRALRGPYDSEIAWNVWPSDTLLSLALRGTEAGLVWAVYDGHGFRLFLTRADLATGGAGDPTEVAAGDGTLDGADVVGVGEGYLVAFNEQEVDVRRTVVVPTRRMDDLGVEVRSSITVFEETDPAPATRFGAPSLAYDGLDAYVSVTVPGDEWRSEVRVQRLACHR